MGLTTHYLTSVRPVVDESSLERLPGVQIAWEHVTATNADGAKIVPAFTVMARRADGLVEPRSYSQTITDLDVASNVATATLAAHSLSVGEQVYVSGAAAAYANGVKTIATVADANTFTFEATGANASNIAGTITVRRVASGYLETNATQNSRSDAKSGYGFVVGGVLFENLLPDATGTPKVVPSQYKTELVSAGCTVKYASYSDSRAS